MCLMFLGELGVSGQRDLQSRLSLLKAINKSWQRFSRDSRSPYQNYPTTSILLVTVSELILCIYVMFSLFPLVTSWTWSLLLLPALCVNNLVSLPLYIRHPFCNEIWVLSTIINKEIQKNKKKVIHEFRNNHPFSRLKTLFTLLASSMMSLHVEPRFGANLIWSQVEHVEPLVGTHSPRDMRKKFGQPSFPTLYFKDGVLSIPGYTFEKVCIQPYGYCLSLIPFLGRSMARHWEYDNSGRRKQLEGWVKCPGEDCTCSIEWLYVPWKRGSYVGSSRIYLRPQFLFSLSRLGRMASSLEGQSIALRMIDFLKIPRESGDCVVLLLVHPGLNLLGRYLPPSKVNDLLVADASRSRTANAGHGDIHMMSVEEPDLVEEMEAFDIMDLASFLEYDRLNWLLTSDLLSLLGLQSKRHVVWKFYTSDAHNVCFTSLLTIFFFFLKSRTGSSWRLARSAPFCSPLNPGILQSERMHFIWTLTLVLCGWYTLETARSP